MTALGRLQRRSTGLADIDVSAFAPKSLEKTPLGTALRLIQQNTEQIERFRKQVVQPLLDTATAGSEARHKQRQIEVAKSQAAFREARRENGWP